MLLSPSMLEIYNSIVDTFFILEQTSKRFITIPVCKAFEPLIKSFEYSDMPVEKFKDFLDFFIECDNNGNNGEKNQLINNIKDKAFLAVINVDGDDLDDEIAHALSDLTGFCVEGCNYTIKNNK